MLTTLSRSLLGLVALFSMAPCLGGCSDRAPLPSSGGTSSNVVASGVTSAPKPLASASATSVASASAKPVATSSAAPSTTSTAGKPVVFKQMADKLSERCKQPGLDGSNVEMKEAWAKQNDCFKKIRNTDLDAVLLPWKTSDAPRYKALMSEQAEWNKFEASLREVIEQSVWLDFEDGTHDDGTLRSVHWLGCTASSELERIYYAKVLGQQDPAGLAIRASELKAAGTATADFLKKARAGAIKWSAQAPASDERLKDSAGWKVGKKEWKELLDHIDTIESNAKSMAKSSCASFGGLKDRFASESACVEQMTTYYLGHCEPFEAEGPSKRP